MTMEQINLWETKRLKKQNGEWENDVLCCVSHAMEECGPCYGTWDRNPTITWNYVRLVEIACEYLREKIDLEELDCFLQHILGGGFSKGITYLNPSRKKRL